MLRFNSAPRYNTEYFAVSDLLLYVNWCPCIMLSMDLIIADSFLYLVTGNNERIARHNTDTSISVSICPLVSLPFLVSRKPEAVTSIFGGWIQIRRRSKGMSS